MQRLVTALAGPVFTKEMIELARGRRHYLVRVLYGLALLGGLCVIWLAVYGTWRGGAADTLGARARLGEFLFRMVSLAQLGAIAVFAPVFLSGAVAGEREEGKFDALLMTGLSDREIVVGKLVSRSLILMLLVFMATPFLGLFIMFGGVEPAALGRVSLANLTLLLFTGSECLYLSVRSHGAATSLVRAYWRLALLLGALPAVALTVDHSLASGPGTTTQHQVLTLLAILNPATCVFLAVDGFAYHHYGPLVFAGALALPGAWSVFRTVQSIYLLRQPPDPVSRVVRRSALAVRDFLYAHTRLEHEIEVQMVRMRQEWPFRRRRVSNPLWQRARVCSVFDPHHYMARTQIAVALAVAAFNGPLMAADRRRDLDKYALPALGTVWAILLLMAAVQAASSIIGDKRRGFFDLVLATPLSGCAIVDGVFCAIGEHLRWFFIVPLILTFLFGLSGNPSFFGFLSMALVGTLLCLLLMIVGLSFSLAAWDRAGALTAVATFVVVIQFAVPALAAAFGPATVAGVTILGTVGGLVCYWVRPGLPSMCFLFTAAHSLFLVLVWSFFWVQPTPGATARPPAAAPWAILTLPITAGIDDWGMLELLYSVALMASVLLGRRWIIRRFDHLAERIPSVKAVRRKPSSLSLKASSVTPGRGPTRLLTGGKSL